MNFKVFLVLLSALLSLSFLLRTKEKSLIGKEAPSFSLKDETGTVINSADIFKVHEKIVIYFYPKDSSPYCTAQACSIRDGSKDFASADIFVIGISYDTPASHKKFKEKHHLPFMLLSDEDKKVAQLYGAASKNLYIPRFWPISRMTFLIKKGIIKQCLVDTNVSQHATEILDAFKGF